MLKTIKSTGSVANSKETKNKIGDNSVVGYNMISGSEVINQTNFTKKNSGKND